MVRNRLDKQFGSTGTTAGVVILSVGVLICWYSLAGMILVLIGAFVGLTSTSTKIEPEQKRIMYSNDIFGFISIGKWLDIKSDMKLGVRKINRVHRTYSRGQRALDIKNTDYRIFLFDNEGKKIMPIKKFSSSTAAKADLEILCDQLKLKVI